MSILFRQIYISFLTTDLQSSLVGFDKKLIESIKKVIKHKFAPLSP